MKKITLTKDQLNELLSLYREELVNDINCDKEFKHPLHFLGDTLQMMKDNPEDFEMSKDKIQILQKLEKIDFHE